MTYNQPHNPRNYFGSRQQGSRMRGGNPYESTNYDVPPYDPSAYEREPRQNQGRQSEGRQDDSYRRDQDFRHNQDYRSSQQEFMDSDYELGGRNREDWEQSRYSQQNEWDRQQSDHQQQSRGGFRSAQFSDRPSNFEERPQRFGGEGRYASERNQFRQEGYYPPQGAGWPSDSSQRYQSQRNPNYSNTDPGDTTSYGGGYTQQDAGFQGWLDRGFQGEHQGFRGTQQTFRGRAPKGYERSDERIKEDLCERLMHDHLVDASEITVTVKTGVVTLEGTIGDRNQKYRAEDLADHISGVKDVQNQLNIVRPNQQQSAQGGSGGTGSDFGRGTQGSDLSKTSTQNVTRQ